MSGIKKLGPNSPSEPPLFFFFFFGTNDKFVVSSARDVAAEKLECGVLAAHIQQDSS